jgi:SAM-dependent methyltransferase
VFRSAVISSPLIPEINSRHHFPLPTDQNDRVISEFDEQYYRRFYGGRGAVHSRTAVGHLAGAVLGMAKWWGVPIRSVLDVGAGPGYWRDWFAANQPKIKYVSTDVSQYACEKYAHVQRDISAWAPAKPSDLVVCQGVLQYLDDKAAATAILNLRTATSRLLYLEIPTSEDRAATLDLERSDLDAYWRPAQWYRSRLRRHFSQAGAGLWIRPGQVRLYELEGPPSHRPR